MPDNQKVPIILRIYFSAMLLLVTAGIICRISATSTRALGLGMVLFSVGAGGISAGVMTPGHQSRKLGVGSRQTGPNES